MCVPTEKDDLWGGVTICHSLLFILNESRGFCVGGKVIREHTLNAQVKSGCAGICAPFITLSSTTTAGFGGKTDPLPPAHLDL
jgi:hypothetical protein